MTPFKFLVISLAFSFLVIQKGNAQNVLWMKSTGGPLGDYNNQSTIDRQGNLFVVGSFSGDMDADPGPDEYILSTTPQSEDGFLIKLNSNGEILYARSLLGNANGSASKILVDDNLNYYILGTFNGSFDADPGPDSLILTSPFNRRDNFLLKYDSTNKLIWGINLRVTDDFLGIDQFTMDKDDNVYCAGTFSNTMDLDPGEEVYELTSNGRNDIYVLKLNSEGKFIWAKSFGGIYDDESGRVLINNREELIVVGEFRSKVDFDPGPDTTFLTSTAYFDVFILNLTSDAGFNWVKKKKKIWR